MAHKGNIQNLPRYLDKVVSLEKSLFTQDRIINQVKERINSLGHKTNYARPNQPYHQPVFEKFDDFSTMGYAAVIGAVGGGIIGAFSGGMKRGAIIGAIALAGLWLLLLIAGAVTSNSDANKAYKTAMYKYDSAVLNDAKRVKAELEEKERLVEFLDMLKKKRQETGSILQQYYDKDVIFPKYRNLVAVCSFYEYFASGRCSTLIGHEGAYNIYENEVRLERILTKLDEIIQRLDTIKSNQYILYDVIQEGNRISQRLVQEVIHQSKMVKRIEENTAVAAYYAEVSANNSEACAWIGVANYYRK